MKFDPIDPPRVFVVGRGEVIHMQDCARILLEPDEQVTFTTPTGGEYDVARKSFGFYATPSLNSRLPGFGLRAALSRNPQGRYFVFLVETGREAEFERYLELELNVLVTWLDNDADLARIEAAFNTAEAPGARLRCLCGSERFATAFVYEKPPAGEVKFVSDTDTYRRELLRCETCGHFRSIHFMADKVEYTGGYVDATYGDLDGIRRSFERIVGLPLDRSDNAGRVGRILDFAASHLPGRSSDPSILDVGSGLCVFLHGMKAAGWRCTALDPDPRAVRHARETVGVDAVCRDFMTATDLGQHDVVSFNKVLEHVADPVAMLARSAALVSPGGFVYVELPDGEAAIGDGPGREEFFIDHPHVFSAASLAILCARAGFQIISSERLREPSTKFTLWAFIRPHA